MLEAEIEALSSRYQQLEMQNRNLESQLISLVKEKEAFKQENDRLNAKTQELALANH